MDDTLHKFCCFVVSALLGVYDVVVRKYCNLKEDDKKRKFV